ncbi:MAG: murein biosynthesis integral membrane protein MurJ [SAR324 cluster bacterium]|nr:murein biosynthesis integral membrane protein MurJ [SAR324 cluster bacterium]
MEKTNTDNSVESQTPISTKRQLYRRAGTISFFTLISRILGAFRDLVIAYVFGAGWITDAFYQALTIPNLLRRLTAEGSMTLAFIPIYTDVREKQGKVNAVEFAQKVLGLTLWVTVFLTAVGMIFSSQLVHLVATGFRNDPEKFYLTADLTRLMFPYLVFVSLVAWAMGVLNAEKRFAAPAAAPMFLNLGIIGAALGLSPFLEKPIVGIGWGVLTGGLFQILLQIPELRRIGQSLRPRWPWRDPNIVKLLRLLGPSLFGVAVYQINIMILRNIASFLPDGQVTYYYNASRLTELVGGLFAFAFTTASFPDLSLHSSQKDWDETNRTLRFTFTATLFFVLPSTFGLLVAAEPIVAMMYLRGAYSLHDVQQTIPTLQAFALGIPAIASIRLLVSVFYALKDTKTPVFIAALSLLATGSLGWWWSLSLEVVGLALGLSAGTWFQSLLLIIFLSRKKEISMAWLGWSNLLKYLLASSLMGIFAWQISQLGNWQKGSSSLENWVVFLGLLGGAMVVYFTLLLLFKDSHALRWLRWIARKG